MKELRIALVLFGGVSLAVYMNGVVTEIWHIAQASRYFRRPTAEKYSLPKSATVKVYHDLLAALDADQDTSSLRVVIDTVAGTSAGGLNGVALSKSLVEGGDFSVLNKVWIEFADIHQLKTQVPLAPWPVRILAWGCYQGLRFVRPQLFENLQNTKTTLRWLRDFCYRTLINKGPAITPFDGGDFTLMIATAFKSMRKQGDRIALLPDRSQFNLFVTQTDLFGWPQHLSLNDSLHEAPQTERTHAQVLAFHNSADPHSRIRPRLGEDAVLVFASRGSAGFPMVFEPINYDQISRWFQETGYETEQSGQPDAIETIMPDYQVTGLSAATAWMVDGGILDNKPFGDVLKTIATNPAEHQVDRHLLYVEPDPDGFNERPPLTPPGFWAGLGQLLKLLRHEPIAQDLRTVDEYNAKVKKIRSARAATYRYATKAANECASWPKSSSTPVNVEDLLSWRHQTNQAVANQHPAYGGYLTLKRQSASHMFALIIIHTLHLPENARQAYLIRAIIDAWISQKICPQRSDHSTPFGAGPAQTEIAFLRAFDIKFRQRRLFALLDAANDIYVTDDSQRATVDSFKRTLANLMIELENLKRSNHDISEDIRKVFGGAAAESVTYIHRAFNADKSAFLNRHDQEIEHVYNELSARFAAKGEDINNRMFKAIAAANIPEITTAFVLFPFLDLVTFPLMELAGIENLIPVKTMRISPRDATILSQDSKRLKCRKLDGFFGFFSRNAREYDLLWGRLDGAERLVTLIIVSAMKTDEMPARLQSLKSDFIRRAHKSILAEERQRPDTSIADEIAALEKQLSD